VSNLILFTLFKIEEVIKLYRAGGAGGIVSASKVFAEELRSRAENGEETPRRFGIFSCLRRSLLAASPPKLSDAQKQFR